MVHVIIIGDQRFYRDVDKTTAEMPHYIMSAVGDMTNSIATLARRFAPGALGTESVGEQPVVPMGGNMYQGEVGVKRFPKHAQFVHGGTGMFGPLHRPYTMRKKMTNFPPNWGLDRTGRPNPAVGNVFKIPALNGRGVMIGGAAHYFRNEVTVMGQRPQPYLTEAFDVAKRTEIPIRVHRLAHQIVR